MKINFWQIIGVLLVLAGIAGIAYRELATEPAAPKLTPPATRPTTTPLPLAMTPSSAR